MDHLNSDLVINKKLKRSQFDIICIIYILCNFGKQTICDILKYLEDSNNGYIYNRFSEILSHPEISIHQICNSTKLILKDDTKKPHKYRLDTCTKKIILNDIKILNLLKYS